MTDAALRERIEKAMRERSQAHGLLICADDAVSVALAEVERERERCRLRAEAAEKALDRAADEHEAYKTTMQQNLNNVKLHAAAAEKERDEARKALAERGHVVGCQCRRLWESDEAPERDPRCAPEVKP